MRIAACIEYDGTHFCGWQTQVGARTVQAEVEQALSRVADTPLRVVCAGRTDTKVHATGQIVHFDTPVDRPERAWVLGGNVHLPADVSLKWAKPVAAGFHARFSADHRAYRYIFANTWTRPTLLRERVAWFHRTLDIERMQTGARHLLGEHDFTSLRAVACQAKTPVRQIHSLQVWRSGDFVYIDVVANAFLHHMVRNIAGMLLAVGSGEHPPDWIRAVLAARDRRLAGVTAPPQGLYLVQVGYDADFSLPTAAYWPCFG